MIGALAMLAVVTIAAITIARQRRFITVQRCAIDRLSEQLINVRVSLADARAEVNESQHLAAGLIASNDLYRTRLATAQMLAESCRRV